MSSPHHQRSKTVSVHTKIVLSVPRSEESGS